MHDMNIVGIVFSGSEGKKAIEQIRRAKPTKNKYTTTVKERSKVFEREWGKIFGNAVQK